MFKDIEDRFDNRYKIIKKLGQGGMGSVYLAETNDRLAYKRAIKEVAFNRTVGDDVLHEAFILKSLEHDGIPRIIEIKECIDINKLFLVQEFVEGVTLESLIKQPERIKDTLIYEWTKQLSEILLYIHQKKVIHSDIKPENIMITREGKVKLIDFGIASKNIGSRGSGYTKDYAAPEQIMGQPMDMTSDLFSMGMVIFHLLTGELPIVDCNQMTFTYLPKLDSERYYPGLTIIINKCLQINKRKRYKDTVYLYNDLRKIKKLTNQYKRQAWTRDLKIGGLLLMLSLGVVLIIAGTKQVEVEKQQTFEVLCEDAEKALNKDRDFDEVEELLLEANELYPDHLDVHTIWAESLLKQKEYELCIEYAFDAYQVIDEDQGQQLNYIVGSAYFEIENYDKAKKYFEYAYELEPNMENYGRDYAVACGRAGDIEACGEVLEDILERGYHESVTYYVSGEYNRAVGNYIEAIEAFENAQRLNLEEDLEYKIIIALAELYGDYALEIDGAYDRLISLLETSLQKPKYMDNLIMIEMLGDAYCSYGSLLSEEEAANNMYYKSIEAFERLVEEGLARQYIYNNLVLLYQKVKEFDLARVMIDEMKDQYPDDYTVQLQLIWLYLLIEDERDIDDRDYTSALITFNQLADHYNDYEDDAEYQQLRNYMLELADKNWFLYEDMIF